MMTLQDWQIQDELNEYAALFESVYGHPASPEHMRFIKEAFGIDGRIDVAIKHLVSHQEQMQEQRAYLDEGDM